MVEVKKLFDKPVKLFFRKRSSRTSFLIPFQVKTNFTSLHFSLNVLVMYSGLSVFLDVKASVSLPGKGTWRNQPFE